jgi:hypothetical protein
MQNHALLFIERRSAENTIRQRLKIGDVDEHKVSDATCAVYERMRGEYRPLSENTGFLPL